MRRIAVLLLTLAAEGSGSAQVVTEFAPPAGPPGALVTLHGHGLGPGVQVFIGGREAGVTFADEGTLQFHVPTLPRGPAAIALAGPGGARHAVGSFTVTSELVVQSFAPQSGPAGTRVELRGGFYERGDVVLLGTMRLPVIEGSRSRLVVAIPAGAPSEAFVVTRPTTGARAVSPRRFKVTLGAAPFVEAVEPPGGPPGTTVRIRGGNFAADDTVSYGARGLVVSARGGDFLEVTVPPDARAGEELVVRGRRGEARAPFALVHAAIAGFTPASGPPGTHLEIAGSGFAAGDEVRLGTQPLTVGSVEERRIVAVVPEGASSGPLSLVRAGRTLATSAQPFRVAPPPSAPVIDGFTPAGGPPGTEVTITGQGLGADVRVSYDDQALPIYSRTGDSAIVVRVPRGAARSAPFVLANKLGETRSGAYFQLALPAIIDSISPTSGPPGTEIVAQARNLRGDEVFALADQPLTVVERSPTSVRLTVPPGAGSGAIRVDASDTPFRFEVTARLAVTSFAPLIGPPGTRVAVRGENLGAAQLVRYGGLPCAIVRRGHDELLVEIPAEAAGADVLTVEAAGQRAASAEPFTVARATPLVGAFVPASGPPGTQVVLAAAGFGPAAVVRLGGRTCAILERGADRFVVVVPEGATGRASFTVVDEDGRRYHTAREFDVVLGRQSPF
jgi:hypothetical protein